MKHSKRDEAIEERRIQQMINAKNHPPENDIEDNGYDWDAIEAYGKEVTALQEAQLVYQSGVDQVVSRLEEKYAADSLKFTLRFVGNIPLVAYGTVFGQYFAFRFRGDTASLVVGTPDFEKDMEVYEREVARREQEREAYAKKFEQGEISKDDLDDELYFLEVISHNVEPPNYDRDDVVPGIQHKTAYLHNVTGEPYSSDLTFEQMEEVFIHLMENLERHDPPRKFGEFT